MMKKLAAFFLAVMLMLSITACELETEQNTGGGTEPTQGESVENGGGTDKAEGGTDKDVNATDKVDDETDKTEDETGKDEISFKEVIVVDNAECMIKITDIEPDSIWGLSLKAALENKSADKTYMFSLENAAINGVQCGSFFASEVAAGKKSNETISLMDDELKENGVGDCTDIELTFRVYDSDDWSADAAARETVHIYPYGEDKAVKFVRETQPTDNVLVDNEYVTVVVTGYEEDEIWGYTVNLYLVNKTDKNVMFSVDEASVNGFMADPFFATSVSAGKSAFSSMSWSNDSLQENGITEIEEIEFELRAYNSDDLFGGDYVNETVKLNP